MRALHHAQSRERDIEGWIMIHYACGILFSTVVTEVNVLEYGTSSINYLKYQLKEKTIQSVSAWFQSTGFTPLF